METDDIPRMDINMELRHQNSQISQLIRKLESIGYEYFEAKSEKDLIENLRRQIERVNQIVFSEVDFVKVMGHLSCLKNGKSNGSGNNHIEITRHCGAILPVHLLDRSDMSKNKFQFAKKLYEQNEEVDPHEVVLYINGLPFANVNLKKMDYLVNNNSSKLKSYNVVKNL